MMTDEDVQRIARAVADEIERRARQATPTRYLDTEQAAAYLGFQTRAGIRHLVYRRELVPDGRGYRGGYVFTTETLDRWVVARAGGTRVAPPSQPERMHRRTRAPTKRQLSAEIEASLAKVRAIGTDTRSPVKRPLSVTAIE